MLTVEKLAQDKGFTVGHLTRFGVRNGEGGVVVPYYDANGNQYIKYRIRRDPSEKNKAGFSWSRGDAPLIPYGLHRPVPYSKGFVWIVEGESDCWTLWTHEIPALGLPGASVVSAIEKEHIEGLSMVAIVQEPGEAGSRFPTRVANRLWDLGFDGKIYAVELSEKDPRALWLSKNGTFTAALAEDFKNRRVAIPRPSAAPVATRSISMGELFDEPIEETTWLIDGILAEGGIALLAASPKAGKSTFGRNLALAVARGKKFLDRQCLPGVVLWCAFEERKEDVIAELKLMGADRTDPIRFYFGSSPQDAVAWINAECDAHRVSLLVLDTWHKFALIENINQYAEVNRANEPLLKLAREKNVAQLWLHHTNKGLGTDGSQVLGSQALFGACDTLLFLTRASDGSRTLRSIQRRGDDLEPTTLEMDEDHRITSAGGKFQRDVAMAEQKILDSFPPEPVGREELRRLSGLRREVFWSALSSLVKDGLVKRTGTGKRISPFLYVLGDSSVSGYPPVSKGNPGTTFSPYPQDLGTRSETPGTSETPGQDEEEGWRVQVGPENDPDMLMDYADKRINQA